MACEEKHHRGPGDGYDEFFSDGRLPIGGGTASKGVHFLERGGSSTRNLVSSREKLKP
jgi:hypothetical protein